MNREKISFGPEYVKNPEALEQAGNERREQLREKIEKTGEQSHENVDEARHEALKQAIDSEKPDNNDANPPLSVERRKNGPISKHAREVSFKSTMRGVQGQMSAPSRLFSKVIHNKVIEQASDMTASTIARPNALLSGSIFAFVLTLGVYITAKNMGYTLSGFESIGAFTLGWVLGIIYDFLKAMITGRR